MMPTPCGTRIQTDNTNNTRLIMKKALFSAPAILLAAAMFTASCGGNTGKSESNKDSQQTCVEDDSPENSKDNEQTSAEASTPFPMHGLSLAGIATDLPAAK